MAEKKQLKITEEDLKFIYGDDYGFFQSKILSNCHCANCPESKYDSTIVNYEIFLNDLNDVILRGFCAKCGGKIGRYSETGEVEKYLPRIKKIKKKYN
jgi:hypothetical protein